MSVRKTNLFVIGGPKCGTTSLCSYLSEHPNIFFSIPKEPHYFAEDLRSKTHVTTLSEYIKLFESSNETHTILGEGSVWNLYSKVALYNIKKYNPDAKIIVMLRNPLDVVQSLHSYWVSEYVEDEISFEKAWRLQEARKNGKYLPVTHRAHQLFQYADIAMFGKQLERLYSIFPSEQIKIIVFEDFSHNPKIVYDDVISFLGLSYYDKHDFIKLNKNLTYRSKLISNFIRKFPEKLTGLVKFIKYITGIKNLNLLPKLHRLEKKLNFKPSKRIDIDDALKTEIISIFIEDIKNTERIINHDLSNWYR